MLTMLDEYTRQCVALRVERQIRSEQVLATLWQAMTTYGIPEHIRSDNGSDRAQIVPGPKEEVKEEVEMSPEITSEGDPTPAQRRHRLAWAVLLARVWAIDVTECPACGGRMKIVAAVTDPCSIRRYLEGVGLPARAPPIAPAGPQRQQELDLQFAAAQT